MRRWNGWGDESTEYHLPDSALSYLNTLISEGIKIPNAEFEQVLKSVPESRLPKHPLVNSEKRIRLLHARGQSLPDWIALRTGKIESFPDGVALPNNKDEVSQIIDWARKNKFHLIPYGGGTSVVGHINPNRDQTPVLTISLANLSNWIDFDETSQLATFGAGIAGPKIEELLNQKGYTLGHFPQSHELSTIGGWIASRSSGQQSFYYGRIEDLLVGAHVETPQGSLEFSPQPASAAGPDLKQILLGSEGRLGIITHATVKVNPLPEKEDFYGIFFHDWEAGMQAVREIAQSRIPVSMARLSDAQETDTNLRLSGKDKLIEIAKTGLNLIRYGDTRCLLILGITGDQNRTHQIKRQALHIIRKHGGLFTGKTIGNIWRKSRFLTPYLRNTLWDNGYAVDTLETALPWSKVKETADETIKAIHQAIHTQNEQALVFSHLSHFYRDGASFYVTYLFRLTSDPDELHERWKKMKDAASQVILKHGGTISHQHGIGTDHIQYLEAEKGSLGIKVINDIFQTLDPERIMNPGKLIN
jgi:alkyldihydroxyacetonephosphate synthase